MINLPRCARWEVWKTVPIRDEIETGKMAGQGQTDNGSVIIQGQAGRMGAWLFLALAWIEDVMVGAEISIASGVIFTTPYHSVAVAPFAGSGTYGVRLGAAW